MRVFSPLGAGVLLHLVVCFGCSSPVNLRDKENSSTTDELEATQGKESTTIGVGGSQATGSDIGSRDTYDNPDAGPGCSAHVVNGDGGLKVLASDSGREDLGSGAQSDVAPNASADSPESSIDGGAVPPDSGSPVDANDPAPVDTRADDETTGSGDPGLVDGSVVVECVETTGHCDPTGSCAQATCQFETSGRSCAFTPTRAVPYTCVVAGDAPDYSPCDLDDACNPGSVCVADTFIGRDMNDNPIPRRSGYMCRPTCRVDADCDDGDWCQPATNDDNEPLPDLKVCHRLCQDPTECYGEPVSADIRCTPQDTLLGLERSECSRKPSNLAVPKLPDTSAVEQADSESGSLSSGSQSTITSATVLGKDLLLLQSAHAGGEVQSYCLSNWDCEAVDALCVDNTCRVGCEQSTDCSDGTECVLTGGAFMCSQPCVFDAEAGNSCSVNPNCGCADDQTCRVNDDQTTSCSAVGDHTYMQWCSNQAQCADGLSCIAGLCRPVCSPGTTECQAGQGECVLSIKSTSTETFTCSGDCDPVSPNATEAGRVPCGIGAVCLPSWDVTSRSHASCAAENPNHVPGARGEQCAEDFDCASGLGCDAVGTCQAWCRADDDCRAGQRCDYQASIYGAVTRYGVDVDDTVGLCQTW